MKFNTDTEMGKLQDALWKQQYNISRSINSVFHKEKRNQDIIPINILSLLSIFPVVSLRQINELASMQYNIIITEIQKLKCTGCIKIYKNSDFEYEEKKLLLPNLYEKGMIIESMEHIKELSKGAVFDMKKWRKIALAQLRRKTKTPYRINNKAIILEITDKGRLLLKKYIKLYSTFFNIPEERFTIGKNVLGLFNKSVDELKKIVQQYDILALMAQNVINRNEKAVSHENT